MEKGKIVKGNKLAHFLLTYQGYSIWSYDEETQFETELKVREIDSDKWYYVSKHENSKELYLVEIDFIGSDGELKVFLKV
ncbi:hypothetical protein [Cytobacillus praedii]|uniref:Uncharacterized protein n=1 Tax=Cytobacillus praedii TaxID=1742358 RepID=A0A4R1ASC5_9BACI|nr:hypothetical protein [Cytobacillus praedii]TCJ00961.1 hypothetical protein E0Y62_26390 [Cytobacillus praedii]